MRPVSNAAIADALHEMALFLAMQEVPFKPRAYEKAAQVIGGLARPLADLYAEGGVAALELLPAIGPGIARRVAGMLDTGSLADLDRLRARTPVDIAALTKVGGLGPKRVQALWDALGIDTVDALIRAAEAGRIRALPGFGERSEANLLAGARLYQQRVGRQPLARVLDLAEAIEARLAAVEGVVQAAVAGSIRRRRDTVGDIDVVVAVDGGPGSDAGERATAAFVGLAEVEAVLARGPSKTMVRLGGPRLGSPGSLDADLRVVAPASYGAALLYFTGSKAHAIALRRRAQARGWKLNEYGLFGGAKRRRRLAGATEAEIYAALELAWIPPELREDAGELEAASGPAPSLPSLVAAADLRGELRVHSNWSDGRGSITALAEAAAARGLGYVVITDHAHGGGRARARAQPALPSSARPLDEDRLRAQIAEIRRVDRAQVRLRVFAGVEVELYDDGTLALPDPLLAELDLVAVAVHGVFDLSRAAMTDRLLAAIHHPHTTMLCHPTCRLLGRRAPIEFDVDAVLSACAQTGTWLEINGQPERLDLADTLVRQAVDAGVRLAITSDAHSVAELDYAARHGVPVARRGWAEAADIVNTRDADAVLAEIALLRRRKGGLAG